ncbi:MAG: UDP-2,3-diacylglucosamine diphosphatase [Hydrogenophaga sp.]|uniref:UDP-2,3-diacylglucosamine diphosphatase n=1 Tax=Hydrogenophaga sp. TaxID=1904254 RepID=UPI0025C4FDEB|nr:UDP-2,3-diacylglucosamine diphosphatase [Hydrogenophaga sp.]MBT9549681.1 UDP-2,3-diacylglucosamine diphosphatase [Hydrogenophaga sp.]
MRAVFEALGGAGLSGALPPGPDADDEPHDDDAGRLRYRAVFVSDVHLGTPGCQAKALLDFLKHHPSDTLYLVGDIIDGWQLRRKWFWPQAHNDVVQKLLRRSRKGCRVVFVPGNHDEFARQFDGQRFGGIEVLNETVHTLVDGRRLWVVHGDHFDGVIQCAKWLAYVGDNLYGVTLTLNRHLNTVRQRLGMRYWSLSQYLKHKVKRAVNHVSDFERAVAAEARQRGFHGVVCGHIHRPEMRTIDGTLYVNDGDWVESLSALVEHLDGRLELLHWHPRHSGGEGTSVPMEVALMPA